VADSFHTKPLRRYLQTTGRYQILGLSLEKIQIFEGSRDAIDEIGLASGVPQTRIEAVGEESSEAHLTVASYGGVGQGAGPMHHGDGGGQDQKQADTERFFRAVDDAVLKHHSRPSGLPLILAALPEHQSLFRRLSENPALMEEGILVNPDVLLLEELQERTWKVVEPQYQARLANLTAEFEAAKAHSLGSNDLAQVAKAAASGRIATLLLEAGRRISGKLDSTLGRVEMGVMTNPQVDDLLDDLGELVEKMGGQVMVIPSERMPGDTGLAAVYRY
jgi:hypothetical protein